MTKELVYRRISASLQLKDGSWPTLPFDIDHITCIDGKLYFWSGTSVQSFPLDTIAYYTLHSFGDLARMGK